MTSFFVEFTDFNVPININETSLFVRRSGILLVYKLFFSSSTLYKISPTCTCSRQNLYESAIAWRVCVPCWFIVVDSVILQIRGRLAIVGQAIASGFTSGHDGRHFHSMVTSVELYQHVQDSDTCSRWVFPRYSYDFRSRMYRFCADIGHCM